MTGNGPRIGGAYEQILAIVALFIVPTLWINRTFGRGFWEVGGARVWMLVPLTAVYALGAAYIQRRSRTRAIRARDLLVPALATGAAGFGALQLPVQLSTAVIAIACAGSIACHVLISGIPGFHRAKIGLLLAVIGIALGAHSGYALGYLPRDSKPEVSERTIASNLYGVLTRSFKRPVPLPLQSGGAIAKLRDDYLLAVGDGTLFRFADPGDESQLPIREIDLRIPTNPEAFREAAADLDLRLDWFRVADIETVVSGDSLRLFASYHYWNASDSCYTVRVSSIELTRAELDLAVPDDRWVTLFESTPCIPLRLPADGKPFFGGLQIGGRMAMVGTDTLLVTMGDHEFDGLTAPIAYPQDTSTSYGKIFAISLKNRRAEMISWGHRNPQGLAVGTDGAIWSTEHGPKGGDELNRIQRGRNYGWPVVTYGVQYTEFAWPFNPRQGAHDGYEEPLFAWVPSIGVSSVLQIANSAFDAWKGDLLAGSLERMALWRLRLSGDRVVVAEPIELGVQVRDMIEGHSGNIVVWSELTPGPYILFLAPNNRNDSGSALFVQCSGCHTIGNGEDHGIGPDLAGIVGKRIGSSDYNYSAALRGTGGSWTAEKLDAFLRNPTEFAPGTSMRFKGIPDAEARRALIEYLESARSN